MPIFSNINIIVIIIISIVFSTRVLIKLCIYYLNGKDDEVSSLSSLLKTLNLEKYEQVLKEAGVTDLETFATLRDIDLKDTMGITLLGPRRKMTSAIEKLRVTSFYFFIHGNINAYIY